MLLDALDFCLLRWTNTISGHQPEVSHRQYELYFQQLLLTATNKAHYYERTGYLGTAYNVLMSVHGIYSSVKVSINPNTQHICAQYMATIGNIFMDHSAPELAMPYFVDSLKMFHQENRALCRDIKSFELKRMTPKIAYKIQQNVFLLLLNTG